jgi:hypothetical protein
MLFRRWEFMKQRRLVWLIVLVVFVSICGAAQENPYPNEVAGFEFFGKGKLKGLQPGFSTRTDVSEIFGDTCESRCEYDETFWISIGYLSATSCYKSRKDDVEYTTCPREELVGTLYSIELTPTRPISFLGVRRTGFSLIGVGAMVSSGGGSLSFTWFGSENGLSYSVINNTDNTRDARLREFVEGDLYKIEYRLSKETEKRIFSSVENRTHR